MLLPGDTIALWDDEDRLAVEKTEPRPRNANCDLCDAHKSVPSGQRCIKPGRVGDEGPVLLVVGAWPTVYESEKGEPFLGAYGRKIRATVAKSWPGQVVYDYAIKCPAKDEKPAAAWYHGCRPYLARTVEFFNYDRVILIGREACRAFLGRSVDVASVAHPWAWSTALEAPVFATVGVKEAAGNRATEAQLHATIERACTIARPARPPFGATARRFAPWLQAELDAWAEPATSFVVDVETEGRIYDNDFALLSVAVYHEHSDTGWLWSREDCVLGTLECEALSELLTSRPMDAHNRNYEVQSVLKALGIITPDGGQCSMIRYKLHKANAFVALEALQDVVGLGGSKDEMGRLLSAGRAEIMAEVEADAQKSDDPVAYRKRDFRAANPDAYAYGRVPPLPLARYNARDTFSTVKLLAWERVNLNPVFETTWNDHVGPLTEACSYMERIGLRAERNHARRLQRHFGGRIQKLTAELNEWAEINWGSSKQVAGFLYDDIKLPVPWMTEGGAPSTDKYALEKLRSMHDVPALLLQLRRASTLSKTYAWGIERFIQDDGRVHTSFKVHGTEPGRLSSSAPNQQNSPRADDPDGKLVKDLYLASKGRRFIVFDHSTLEIRIAAGLSQDSEMLRLIGLGVDFHLAAAKIIAPLFGVDPNVVTKKHWLRGAAKTLVFALLYGKSDDSAADDLDVALEIAMKTRESILGTFKGLDLWILAMHKLIKQLGGVWVYRSGMIKSRFRPVPDVYSRQAFKAKKALRVAVNTPVQGGGAEINNAGMVRVYQWLRDNRIGKHVSMPLAVHDSLVLDCEHAACDEVLDVVPRLMTTFDCGAPLAVEAVWGDKLGSCEPVPGR